MMTLMMIPATDTPIEAKPSLLARSGLDAAALLALTAHAYEYSVSQKKSPHGRIQTGAQGARARSKPTAGRGGRIGSVLLALPVIFQNAL